MKVVNCTELTVKELALVIDLLLAEAEFQVLVGEGERSQFGTTRPVQLVAVPAPWPKPSEDV